MVLLDGRPERLLIERDDDVALARLGERHVGRVGVRAGPQAFVDLAVGPPGMARTAGVPPPEGAAVEVEVAAEARDGKGPRLRLLAPAEGAPRRLAPAPALLGRLQAFAPDVEVERGPDAEAAADLAQEAALAITHAFRGGLTLHVEPTRALTAVDVDLAGGEAAGARRMREANLSAIRHAARLLRLKALGGVAAIDLLGFPDPALRGLHRAEAERAFAPDDQAEVAAPDRFGLLHVSRPHREQPPAFRLLDADGRPAARTVAQHLLRAILREGRADPGVRLRAVVPPDVAAALRHRLAASAIAVELREVACARADAHIARA